MAEGPRFIRHHLILTIAFLIALAGTALAAGGISNGSEQRAQGKVYACVERGVDELRLSTATARCPAGEQKISWNSRGRPGERGPRGARGAAGPSGQAGSAGPAGAQGEQGAEGRAGVEGLEGREGKSGVPGAQGAPGSAGAMGPMGPEGRQGSAGAMGPMGAEGKAGPIGMTGAEGKEGREGKAGPEGPAGAEGKEGKEGKAGAEGREGKEGPAGPAGAEGKEGKEGKAGAEGPAGPEGKEGPAGPEGKEGPAGPEGKAAASEYGYGFELASLTEAAVLGGADVPFSNNGPLKGVTHTAGATTFTIPSSGSYRVGFTLSYTVGVGAALGIAVNGTVEAGTIVSLLGATGEASGESILSLAAGDVLALRDDSAIPLTMALTPADGASLLIQRLS